MKLLLAWLLDLLLGDPAWLPHPVVAFGKWISFWEHRLNKGLHRKLKGALFALASIFFVFLLTWVIFHCLIPIDALKDSAPLAFWRGVAGEALSILLIFFCLAGHTLRREVRDVFLALDRSLDDGRRQVARIVGRDTAQLSAQEVRTAALETLAENLSDGVIAPLFWYALAGVPGMLTYKMINTLDSMIGYRTERYKDFGCWAARIDDVANFIPARLTALLMIISYQMMRLFGKITSTDRYQLSPYKLITFVCSNGRKHASPNSGYPEAALAGILNCQFGGTHDYFGEAVVKPYIGNNPRALTNADLHTSLRVCFLAEFLSVTLLVLSALVI
ncbi:MAG: adenosylcobinamide-phosphate synthase CbiB [Bacteroidaceae bacterium]|nr:adenosylcobinamide-phosphate synthase CbiB [Bacteroidaceae bacterium]